MDIGVVLVTYNRKAKLEKSLKKFEEQVQKPSYIIIVDNASTDGTDELLKIWKSKPSTYQKIVITNTENVGGSGGFYLGLSMSLKLEANWVWVSDDDAYPEQDALKEVNDYLENYDQSEGKLAAICGAVYVGDQIDVSHRRISSLRFLRIDDRAVELPLYRNRAFDINEFSYVGTVISKEAMYKAGLVNKDYFIHYDDTEHSLRLSKYGRIVCIPSVKIIHDISQTQSPTNKMYMSSWTKYYDYRNLLDMYRNIYPKKYYIIQYSLYRMKSLLYPFFGMNHDAKKILDASLYDAKNHQLGIHRVYNPRYKAGEQKRK